MTLPPSYKLATGVVREPGDGGDSVHAPTGEEAEVVHANQHQLRRVRAVGPTELRHVGVRCLWCTPAPAPAAAVACRWVTRGRRDSVRRRGRHGGGWRTGLARDHDVAEAYDGLDPRPLAQLARGVQEGWVRLIGV
jgi:hypothetical protein